VCTGSFLCHRFLSKEHILQDAGVVCALVVLYRIVAEVRNIIAGRWGYVSTDSFIFYSI
jgi:hypothetical protein